MWGRARTASQLSVLLLVELPIRLLMLLVINVVGLVLPEVVVWMARTIMIRHARLSSSNLQHSEENIPVNYILQVRGDVGT